MGRTQRDIRWSFIVDKNEHWTQEHKDEFEAQSDTGFDGYDDWVYDLITTKMQEAGLKFMEENPDLFFGDLV